MIQRFEGFPRGGRLNIAAQDLSDRTQEDIRVSEDKDPAGIYVFGHLRFSPDVIDIPSGMDSPFLEWVVLVFKTLFRSEHPLVHHTC